MVVLLFQSSVTAQGRAHARENCLLAEFYHAAQLFRKALGMSLLSKLGQQVGNPDAQRGGDSQQRVQANPLLPALDFANINGVEIGLFRQFFLAHFGAFAVLSDAFSNDFALVLNARHSREGEQNSRSENHTQHGFIFVLAILWGFWDYHLNVKQWSGLAAESSVVSSGIYPWREFFKVSEGSL
jgi:hypothetical protein